MKYTPKPFNNKASPILNLSSKKLSNCKPHQGGGIQRNNEHSPPLVEGVKGIRVKLRIYNYHQSIICVEPVMSPAGWGAGGGPDSPIASTIFSILCITPLIFLPLYPPPEGDRGRIFPQASLCFLHFLTQIVCKRSQSFVVGVIIGFIGFWFFPHCFRVPFPPP